MRITKDTRFDTDLCGHCCTDEDELQEEEEEKPNKPGNLLVIEELENEEYHYIQEFEDKKNDDM